MDYKVNGNWVISWPGDFRIAGTVMKYERADDDKQETITIAGPTVTNIHITVSSAQKIIPKVLPCLKKMDANSYSNIFRIFFIEFQWDSVENELICNVSIVEVLATDKASPKAV